MKNKKNRIIVFALLAIAVIATGVFAAIASSTPDEYEKIILVEDISKFRGETNIAPKYNEVELGATEAESKQWIFAGWFSTKDCTMEDAIATTTTTGSAYAKFVPAEVLQLKAQAGKNLRDNTNLEDDDVSQIRFITTVDSLNYAQAGFEIQRGNGEIETRYSNKVYTKLYANEEQEGGGFDVREYKPTDFHAKSKYFKAWSYTTVPSAAYSMNIAVTPLWITLDGTTVRANTSIKCLNQGRQWKYIFVDDSGNDETGVGTYGNPYATLNGALAHMKTYGQATGGTVLVKDNLQVANAFAWAEHGLDVTISGYDNTTSAKTIDFSLCGSFNIHDAVTFSDINITWPEAGDNPRILANGHKLVVAEDVTTTNECNQILGGGGGSVAVESTDLRLYAGTYKTIYGGVATGPVKGNTNVIIGGKVNNDVDHKDHNYTYQLFGAGWQGSVQGNTNIKVEDGAKFNYVFGGGQDASTVIGSTNIDFAGDAHGIYGGSYKGVNGDTHVKIQPGADVYQVFGGSQNVAMTGDTDVQILGGTIHRRVYGGCYNVVSTLGSWSSTNGVTGNTSVTVWPEADLAFDYSEKDDIALYAISRGETTFAREKGTFIFNEDTAFADKRGQHGIVPSYFSTQSSHYLVLTNGNTADNSLGTVTAAGNCINIKPADGQVAKVMIDGSAVHYTEGESYEPLPSETTTTPIEIKVEFSANKVTDFVWEAKIGTAYYAVAEDALLAFEKCTSGKVELNSNFTEFSLTNIVIKDCVNGKVTTDKKVYKQGDTITVTAVPDEGYNCTGLTVNGTNAALTDSIHTFTASADEYTLEATFVKKIFADNASWDLTNQHTATGNYTGTVSVNHTSSNSTQLYLYDKYTDIDLTLNARDYTPDDTANLSYVVLFDFDGGQKVYFRLTCDNNKWGIQSMGGLYEWKWPKNPLTDAQRALYQSEAGIDFRVVRSGTDLFFYLDGERVCESVDLTKNWGGTAETDITADMPAKVSIRQDGDAGIDIGIKYKLAEVPKQSVITKRSSSANGAVTTAYSKYLVGDSVAVTPVGNEGYSYNSLKVDGSEQVLDWNTGVYAFTASAEEHVVVAGFAEKLFDETSGTNNWTLFNQNKGLLKGNASDTGILKTKDNYSVVTVDWKNAPSTSAGMSYGMHVRYYFADDVYVDVQLIEYAGAYILKSADKNSVYENNKEYWGVSSTDPITEKIEREGAQLKIVQSGTKMMFYIDGALQTLKCQGGNRTYIDLTKTIDGKSANGKGITATSKAKIAFINTSSSPGQEIPFTLSNPIIDNQVDEAHGTISFAKPVDEYVAGEEVVMTIARNSGYYPNIQVNGEQAVFESNGTYTFTAKETNTITGAFEKGPWTDKANWDLLNQRSNIIKTRYATGSSGWLFAKGNYQDVTVRVKDYLGINNSKYIENVQDAFEMRVIFQFDTDATVGEDKNVAIRLYNNDGRYQIETVGTASGNYVYKQKWITTISDETLKAKIQNEGVDWKIIREGTALKMYIDGVEITQNKDRLYMTNFHDTTTATGITAETPVYNVVLVNLGNRNCDIEIPYRLAHTVQTANIDTTGVNTTKGAVNFDKNSYIVGEKVTMTVSPSTNYYPNLQIDGEQVVFSKDQTYTFIAGENHTITGAFEKGAWGVKETWDVLSQNSNLLRVNYTGAGSKWLDAEGDYEEVTVKVKDYLGAANSTAAANETAFEVRVIFQFNPHGEEQTTKAALRLYNNDGSYQIQGIDGDKYVYRGAYITTLDATIAQKIQNEGVDWRVVREGTTLRMYIDGVEITHNQDRLDMTKFHGTANYTGITADTNVIRATLVHYGNKNCDIEIPFKLVKRPEPVTLSMIETVGGTVVAQKETYRVNDEVTVSGKARSGYV